MTDYGLPFIADKNLFAAVMQARMRIAEYNELPSEAIARAAARFKVDTADVGYLTCIGVAWTMAVRTLRRENRATPGVPTVLSYAHGNDPESMISY